MAAAMRGAMDGDVAAERQLNAIERLLALMPRSRGFRVHADASISVYPASPRARLPAAKQKSSPRLSKREPRSEQAGRASVLRTTGSTAVATGSTAVATGIRDRSRPAARQQQLPTHGRQDDGFCV